MANTNAPERLMPDQANRLLLKAVDEPPIAMAYHHWDREKRVLTYTYNNRRIMSIHIPGDAQVHFRHGADGAIQSLPFHQQVFIMLTGQPTKATVTFEMSHDAINMRPHRAGREQAIVGQLGRPCLPGVNGMYDVDQDFMVAWFGHDWKWLTDSLTPDADGNLTAQMEVELNEKTWVISFKPHYYSTHLGYNYHKPWEWRPNLKPVVGWCTWEAHRRNLSEEKILDATNFFAEKLRPWGFEYVQIDDGYEKLPLPTDIESEDGLVKAWLETTDEFPGGHEGVIAKIKQQGLEPGIWTSGAIYNDEFAEKNPEILICDENGEPVLGDWVRYVLDCTEDSLEKYIFPVYEGLKDFGYSYCKIDAIRHLHFDGLHEAVLLGLMDNETAEHRYRRYLETARRGLGDDVYWLSSWGIMTQMVGLADACRISPDAMPTWAGMQMQLVESARWFFMQRILWLNDPDHVCVRAPLEWSRCVLSMVGITGGLFMLSDAIHEYDEDRLDLVRKVIPPIPTVAGETGPINADYAGFCWTKFHGFGVLEEKPFDVEQMTDEEARNQAGEFETQDDNHPFATLWGIHVDNEVGRWTIVGRFATIGVPASTINISELSLDDSKEYLLFDFWKERYLGVVKSGFDVPAMELGHCQVLSVREVLDRPQLLSTTRHVSQGAVSVKSQEWSGDALTMTIEGVRGSNETYWVHAPKGYAVAEVAGEGFTASAGDSTADAKGGAAIAIKVDFPTGEGDRTTGTLTVKFTQ